MAPAIMSGLTARQYGYGENDCYSYYGNGCNSTWDRWARWLVLALIIIGAILIFFLFSCVTARRRRRMGYQPYRGTAWSLGRTPPGHAPAQYNNAAPHYAPQTENQQPYYNNSNNPAPAPAPPPYGAANDYYGRQNDVELQPPSSTYQPPKGRPPGHE